MPRPRSNDAAAAQLPLLGFVEFVPLGDNTWRAVPQRPVQMASIREAARATGRSRKNIYRLFLRGFIKGDHSSPGKIRVDLGSLREFIRDSEDPDYWTPARKKQYRGE